MKTTKQHFQLFNKHLKLQKNKTGGKNSYRGEYPGLRNALQVDTEIGGAFDPVTGECYSYFEMQKSRYNALTYPGIRTAFFLESSTSTDSFENYPELDKRYLEEKITEFHANIHDFALATTYGIDPDFVKNLPFWCKFDYYDMQLKFCLAQTNRIGQPLTLYRWSPTPQVEPSQMNSTSIDFEDEFIGKSNSDFEMSGVNRVKRSSDKKIFFVEDPLQAILLRNETGHSIYIRPDSNMYWYNDYQKIIDDKEVICLINDESKCPYTSKPKEVKLKTNDARELLDIYNQALPDNFKIDDVDEMIQDYRDNVKKLMKLSLEVFREAKKDGLL